MAKRTRAVFVALAIVWAVIGVPTEDASADGHLPIVYLTFDDGPSFDDVTASLLDVLAAYDVKATFFPIGNWLPRDPVTSQRLADEGHAIGNHSTTHPRLNLLTREEVISELQGGQNLINAYTGVTPTCYRPPYGATSDEVRDAAASLGLIEWMWTLSTNDFDPASTTASILAALERSVNGSVVLMHDGSDFQHKTVEAVETFLQRHRNSFEFRVLPGCATAAGTTPPPTDPPTEPPATGEIRVSFGPGTAPTGWIAANGSLFDPATGRGWTPVDGQERQCGVRGVHSDPTLDTFCHATALYTQVNGTWTSSDSPAYWQMTVPDGTYDATVTVGESQFHSGLIAHSVQVEGVSVHDRVATSAAAPFAVATQRVVVTDGRLDVTFTGGSLTKIARLQLAPVDTAPPPDPPPEGQIRVDFGPGPAADGWTPSGGSFDGTRGWDAADGTPRQCGVRGIDPDPVRDSFCHATTRYVQLGDHWISIASPAGWRLAVPSGSYEVAVEVGESQHHSSSIAHSVQVEGIAVHDRAVTTTGSPFATATVVVDVADGMLDLTFDGGSHTKIVSAVITPTTAPPSGPPPVTDPPPPDPPAEPPAGGIRVSFGPGPVPDGWLIAGGGPFDGSMGWRSADGTTRPCGKRRVEVDGSLDSFCHAITQYVRVGDVWTSSPSPATWRMSVPNGAYSLTIVVGEATYHDPSILHSVSAEGVVVHDRVVTSTATPFAESTVAVTVTDGSLDLDFSGGTKTKIVRLELVPA